MKDAYNTEYCFHVRTYINCITGVTMIRQCLQWIALSLVLAASYISAGAYLFRHLSESIG